MNSEALRDLAIKALENLKAIDIVTLDVRSLTDLADYMIICSGSSNRHVRSLAENVSVQAKANGAPYVRMEGEQESEWVLVDLGDVIIHAMTSATRSYYNLEDLWEPVKTLRENKSR